MALLSSISSKLDNSLPAVMAATIVTSCITLKPISLQIALGITAHDKSHIETLYGFGVTSTYDEVLRFTASAAHTAAKDMQQMAISTTDNALIHIVADNYSHCHINEITTY